MRVKVLGCSGGIGDNQRTTSLLVDEDILVDAGTGVGDLSIEELVEVNHIFLTHSHLDHVAALPFLLDTVIGMRPHPVTVHALPETIDTLKKHIFNWKIWPDFAEIPTKESPLLLYEAIALGQPVTIKGRVFTPLPANHVVPAVGYRINSGAGSLVFTGDTTECAALWDAVNEIDNLRYLIIETAFSNKESTLAKLSKHHCPATLVSDLAKCKQQAEIFITHLKPGEGKLIMREINQAKLPQSPQALSIADVFEL